MTESQAGKIQRPHPRSAFQSTFQGLEQIKDEALKTHIIAAERAIAPERMADLPILTNRAIYIAEAISGRSYRDIYLLLQTVAKEDILPIGKKMSRDAYYGIIALSTASGRTVIETVQNTRAALGTNYLAQIIKDPKSVRTKAEELYAPRHQAQPCTVTVSAQSSPGAAAELLFREAVEMQKGTENPPDPGLLAFMQKLPQDKQLIPVSQAVKIISQALGENGAEKTVKDLLISFYDTKILELKRVTGKEPFAFSREWLNAFAACCFTGQNTEGTPEEIAEKTIAGLGRETPVVLREAYEELKRSSAKTDKDPLKELSKYSTAKIATGEHYSAQALEQIIGDTPNSNDLVSFQRIRISPDAADLVHIYFRIKTGINIGSDDLTISDFKKMTAFCVQEMRQKKIATLTELVKSV